MGAVIPFQLKQMLNIREDANRQLADLRPEHQERIWKRVRKIVQRGTFALLDIMPLQLKFRLPDGIVAYGVAIIEGVIIILKIILDHVTIFSVLSPAKQIATMVTEAWPVVCERHDGPGYWLDVILSVTPEHTVLLYPRGVGLRTWPSGPQELPLIVPRS